MTQLTMRERKRANSSSLPQMQARRLAYDGFINSAKAKSTEFCSATLLLLYFAASGVSSLTRTLLGTPRWSKSCIIAENTTANWVNGSDVIPLVEQQQRHREPLPMFHSRYKNSKCCYTYRKFGHEVRLPTYLDHSHPSSWWQVLLDWRFGWSTQICQVR